MQSSVLCKSCSCCCIHSILTQLISGLRRRHGFSRTHHIAHHTISRQHRRQIRRNEDLRRLTISDILHRLNTLQTKNRFTHLSLRQTLQALGLGFRNRLDCSCFTFSHQPGGLSFSLRRQNLSLLIALRPGNNSFLMGLCFQEGLPTLPFSTHLLGHDLLDLLRRLNVLDLHASYFQAPSVRCFIQNQLHLRVDLGTRRKCLVQFHIADHATQRRRRQVLQTHQRILSTIAIFVRIKHMGIHDRVDAHRHVILRDHRLRREIQNLFLHAHLLDHAVNERYFHMKAGIPGTHVFAQTFQNETGRLRYDTDVHTHQDS